MDASGKLVMESILETKASTLLQFLAGLRGKLFVSHQGAPFVGDEVHTHNLPQGAPFYNAFSTAIRERRRICSM